MDTGQRGWSTPLPRTGGSSGSQRPAGLLPGLSESDRRKLLSVGHSRRYARGEVVFHEGDPGDTIHLIRKGRVAIRVTTPSGDVLTLAVLEPGDVFGELALFDIDSRRTATAVALEPTETLALRRGDFMELRETHPEVDRFLIDMLAEQIRRLSARLMEAVYVPADKRVARRVLAMGDLYGQGQSASEIPLTQEDLATMAGTSRATVNRVLREVQEAGMVRLHRGRITLLDPERLAAWAR
jgi:CRP/FNR family cyclic AMP-dependent transcriptional regulator